VLNSRDGIPHAKFWLSTSALALICQPAPNGSVSKSVQYSGTVSPWYIWYQGSAALSGKVSIVPSAKWMTIW
jgi:hypothetical protein